MRSAFLLIATNLAVMLLVSAIAMMAGLRANDASGFAGLLVSAAVMGFGGAFISLMLSKWIAKVATGARILSRGETPIGDWLLDEVEALAGRAGIGTPEVAIYDGGPNAFATGADRDSALVAVSSGLLDTMSREEIRAVLAHEISHVRNGDMQTMTLLQGVTNTFVIVLSRVIGWVIDTAVFRGRGGIGYLLSVLVLQVLIGILASMVLLAYSRHREFGADAGAAELLGTPTPMIDALRRLEFGTGGLPSEVAAFGVSGRDAALGLWFSSHPPIKERIAALEAGRPVTESANR